MALSANHKKALVEGRQKAAQERKEAMEALQSNPQFTKPGFWVTAAKQAPELVKKVQKCITKVEDILRQEEIRRLEKRLAQLRGDS